VLGEMDDKTEAAADPGGAFDLPGIVRAALCFALPLVLVAGGTVAGVNRVLGGWTEHQDAFRVDANTDPARGPGQADDVILLGDSITEGTASALQASLSSEFKIRTRGRGGYRIEEMEPYAVELATTQPEQVVINLGTNDVLKNWPIAQSIAGIDRLLDEFAQVRCVHIVTINELIDQPADDQTINERALFLNLSIHRIAKNRNIKVIDWTKALHTEADQGYPRGQLTSDSIHPNSLGRQKLIQMYRDSLRSC
jgi:lysophospholipase L1-like esterase